MPTYEYQCNKCSHRFEVFQQMKDKPVKICPKCGGPARRLISSGAGFIFKGSGFYSTDYRSASYKKGAETEKKNSCSKSDTCPIKSPKKDNNKS